MSYKEPVGTGQIVDLAVTTAKIDANTITETKVATTIRSAGQSLSGAGAVDVVNRTTYYTSTAAGQTLTLADGVRVGQRKSVVHQLGGVGFGGTIEPATEGNFTSAAFTAAFDSVELEWDGGGWNCLGYGGSTVIGTE